MCGAFQHTAHPTFEDLSRWMASVASFVRQTHLISHRSRCDAISFIGFAVPNGPSRQRAVPVVLGLLINPHVCVSEAGARGPLRLGVGGDEPELLRDR